LPVATFEVVQTDDAKPVLSWTHNGTTIAGYDLYLGEGTGQIRLNGGSLLTTGTYTDSGYNDDTRIYTVKAIDTNGVESVGRSLTLPKLRATLTPGSTVKRGIMNRLEYSVSNASARPIDNIRLRVAIESNEHLSESFSLAAGETATIPVIVGGYDNLPDISALSTTIEITPNSGERVRIVRNQEILVSDSALVVNIVNEAFTRGGAGRVQLTIENTSLVETEVILATGGGRNPSSELRVRLVDSDDNILATVPVYQDTGTGVVRLSNGITVARIAPGKTFTAEPVELPVPTSAPENVRVRFELDAYHYRLGQDGHVAISGRSTSRPVNLINTPYRGVVDAVSPAISYGESDIVITGRAIHRDSGQPLATVPLNLVITVNGFERSVEVFTDDAGSFSYTFVPLVGESGVYKISVLHPDLVERPEHGTFTIRRVSLRNKNIQVNIPRNYDQRIPVPPFR